MGWALGAGFGYGLWLVTVSGLNLSWRIRLSRAVVLVQSDRAVSRVALRLAAAGIAATAVGLWRASAPAMMLAALIAGFAAGPLESAWRSQEVSRRRLEEALLLPQFLDRLVIGLTAGLALRPAIAEAVSEAAAVERWRRVADIRDGLPLASALAEVIADDPESVHARLANSLLIATDRGTSLVSTLDALAAEVRSETGRRLMEIAAKKDVQMMLPVVFGILPAVTAVAIYPALVSLSTLA